MEKLFIISANGLTIVTTDEDTGLNRLCHRLANVASKADPDCEYELDLREWGYFFCIRHQDEPEEEYEIFITEVKLNKIIEGEFVNGCDDRYGGLGD